MVLPKSTYYDEHYRQTAALIRARQPYLIRNIFSGIGVIGFALGIYAFSIRAVAQDDFEDVTVPDTPSPMPHMASASTGPATTTTTTPVSDAVLNKRAETSR